MAKQMTRNMEAPQFTLFTKVDCTAMIEYRSSLPFKTSYTTILAKVVADTIKDYPTINASWDDGTKLLLHDEVNMGIAVDTQRGLLVPVIPNADSKSLEDINGYMQDFKDKSEKGNFTLEEMSGGTFIISNLGMFNISHFIAIVNVPNVAILSVGKMVDEAVFKDGKFIPVKTMEIGLNLDHRVVDGATGAKFLTALVDKLEKLN